MSVFVKGVDMPENCYDCPCVDAEFDECAAKEHLSLPTNEYGAADGKIPCWCPLVEVPTPHGRLKDEDQIPPCKIGDTVYTLDYDEHGIPVDYTGRVCLGCNAGYIILSSLYNTWHISQCYFTREEAEAAIKATWEDPSYTDPLNVLTEVRDRIEALPSAQQWIPCNEKLPKDFEEVNITWINTDPAPYYDFLRGKPFTGTAVYYKGRWFWYSAVCTDLLREYGFSPSDIMDGGIKVVAWMPLPEPYKGDNNE